MIKLILTILTTFKDPIVQHLIDLLKHRNEAFRLQTVVKEMEQKLNDHRGNLIATKFAYDKAKNNVIDTMRIE